MAAARLTCADSVVADPAAGRFRGSKRELLVGRILTPALSRWERENGWARIEAMGGWFSGEPLTPTLSPSEGERGTLSRVKVG